MSRKKTVEEVRVAKSWDSFPPVVYAFPCPEGEAISTRFLERKYRLMEDAMKEFVRRVECGEVRSRKTYKQFKDILEDR